METNAKSHVKCVTLINFVGIFSPVIDWGGFFSSFLVLPWIWLAFLSKETLAESFLFFLLPAFSLCETLRVDGKPLLHINSRLNSGSIFEPFASPYNWQYSPEQGLSVVHATRSYESQRRVYDIEFMILCGVHNLEKLVRFMKSNPGLSF